MTVHGGGGKGGGIFELIEAIWIDPELDALARGRCSWGTPRRFNTKTHLMRFLTNVEFRLVYPITILCLHISDSM